MRCWLAVPIAISWLAASIHAAALQDEVKAAPFDVRRFIGAQLRNQQPPPSEPRGARSHRLASDVGAAIRAGTAPTSAAPVVGGSARFSAVFGDHAVLQRAPAKAAVFGRINGTVGSSVSVTVSVSGTSALGASEAYTVEATIQKTPGGNTTWKAFLRPAVAGGSYTISASCSACDDTNATTLHDVTFGDVWFCSGQSNQWLPMRFSFEKNQTFAALDAGKYKNIRTYQVPNVAVPDAQRDEWWVLAEGVTGQGGFSFRPGWELPNTTTVEMFSAACWYFAQELTDFAIANNESVVPFGLIGSYWGGTMVEMWMQNETISQCRNASGAAWSPEQLGRWDIAAGALWNGMVAPFINMTIKGATWYQGENNVFECADNRDSDVSSLLFACGDADGGTGYACKLGKMISGWRSEWSAVPNTTDAHFPFGVVSLAAGTSEGHDGVMGSFRFAQSLNRGILPTDDMPNTFIAQAYDAGEPWGSDQAKCAVPISHDAPWSCEPGRIGAPYTPMFMGGIHPRPKRVVGKRLAHAARALVYGDDKVLWTGPVLKGCKVVQMSRPPFGIDHWIDLEFDDTLLRGDAVFAFHTSQAFANSFIPSKGGDYYTDGNHDSPMEVQVNDKEWVSVVVLATSDREHLDPGKLISGQVRLPPNYNMVTAAGTFNESATVTAIRYAWGNSPCCPRISNTLIPCPPGSCPLGTINSSLPVVPFWARIDAGECVVLSPKR